MKQTLKTFQRPNTQGKLRRLFRTILYFIHDMIKTLEKSRFVQDINRTKPFTMYPFCLTDLNLFARQSDTRNKKNSFVAFVRSFVRKCIYIYIYIYIYVDTNYSFEQTILFKVSDRESYSGSSTR